MTLSKVVSRHHTVWLAFNGRRSVPVRYATTDTEMICFGDGKLSDLQDTDNAIATVHEIADGPPLESFPVSTRTVAGEELSLSTIAEVHGNAPDPLPDGANSYEVIQRERRFVALQPLDEPPTHLNAV